jgi:hypothetical protein
VPGVVLRYYLLNINSRMTLITFSDGKPVLRDSKVGTEEACCCGCPRCIRNGEIDCTYKTEAACEECVRTYSCYEKVQTQCDGECPAGTTPAGDPPTLEIRGQTNGCYSWSMATASLTVGCGAILSATVTSGGYGFAQIGRVSPTVTAAAGGDGSGAELSVTLEQYQDGCGFDCWRVASVAVTAAGTGYGTGDPVVFAAASGDTESIAASGYIEADNDGAATAVVVTAQGKYYREDSSVPAYIENVSVKVIGGGGGSGADIAVTIDDDPESPTFGEVTGLTVDDGGSGYVSLCERTRSVDDCDECPPLSSPESAECLVVTEDGPCGEWTLGLSCEPCHECDTAADCPNFQLPCEDTFPGSPYNCCEVNGERTCKPWACYPGATITLQFRKKVGCVASGNDPDNVLGFVNEGEEFEVAISGGSMSDCSDTSDWSSAPCSTQWTLSTGCVVSDLTCDTSTGPNPAATALCQSCYEFLGWSSCRNDCNGNCA